MNCKPGDLAVIVRSAAGNEGKLVVVREWVGHYRYREGVEATDVWRAECLSTIVGVLGYITRPGESRHFGDSQLRPIRPQDDDAQDESKAWLPPVPTKEHA